MRSRRSILYVPGSDPHKMEKAASSGADCVAFDLEDGVAENRKDEARGLIQKALSNLDFEGSERLVRLNAFSSGRTEADLQAILSGKPDGVLLPKVDSADQVARIDLLLDVAEKQFSGSGYRIALIVLVESAMGILNLREICQASSRLEAVIFGSEDFLVSIGAKRTPGNAEVAYARSAIVVATAAYGLQAIDMVQVNFKDLELVETEARNGSALGFSGKQIIHPAQIAPVQQAFTPSADEITHALEVVRNAEVFQAQGRGAFAMGDLMVDTPVVKRAENVLARAKAAGVLSQT